MVCIYIPLTWSMTKRCSGRRTSKKHLSSFDIELTGLGILEKHPRTRPPKPWKSLWPPGFIAGFPRTKKNMLVFRWTSSSKKVHHHHVCCVLKMVAKISNDFQVKEFWVGFRPSALCFRLGWCPNSPWCPRGGAPGKIANAGLRSLELQRLDFFKWSWAFPPRDKFVPKKLEISLGFFGPLLKGAPDCNSTYKTK